MGSPYFAPNSPILVFMVRKPTSADYWNQTYIEKPHPKLEKALNTVFKKLARQDVSHRTDCGETCQKVHEHLMSQGFSSRVLSGQFMGGLTLPDTVEAPMSRDHIWLSVDGGIVDPTAGQFRDRYKGDFTPKHYREF